MDVAQYIKLNVLKKTGLGDEDFFYGPEDIELSYRLKKYGRLVCDQKIKKLFIK